MKNLSIGTRIGGMVMLFLIATAIIIGLAVTRVKEIERSVGVLNDINQVRVAINDINRFVLESINSEQSFVVAGDQIYLKAFNQSLLDADTQIQFILDYEKHPQLLEEVRKSVGDVQEKVDSYKKIFLEIADLWLQKIGNENVEGVADEDLVEGVVIFFEDSAYDLDSNVNDLNNQALIAEFRRMRGYEKDYLLTKNQSYADEANRRMATIKTMILQTEGFSEDDKEQLTATWQEYLNQFNALAELEKQLDEKHQALSESVAVIVPLLDNMRNIIQSKSELIVEEAKAIQEQVPFQLFIIGAVMVVVFASIGFWTVRNIVKPLKVAVKVANAISEGNLQVNFQARSKDETGQLLGAMKVMVGNTNQILTEITQKEMQLEETSDTLKQSITDLSENAHQVLEHIEHLTQISQDSTTKMDENTLSIEESKESLTNLSDALKVTEKSAQKGKSSNEKDLEHLGEVKKLSAKVETISKEIRSMVNRTNTLALNASIEAAKAGDSGKGFAVVAGEMGGIAKTINDLASQIQEITQDIVKAIDLTQETIQETGVVLTDISGRASNGVDMISHLSERAISTVGASKILQEKMHDLEDKCNQCMNNMDGITMRTNQQTEEVQNLFNFAKSLGVTIQHFKISEEDASPSQALMEIGTEK